MFRIRAARRRIRRVERRIRAVHAGMHAVVDVDGVDAERVQAQAAELGVESMPLAAYYSGTRRTPNSLLLGFGAIPPPQIRVGVARLGRAIATATARQAS